MSALGVFIDPGYAAGIAIVKPAGLLKVYQIEGAGEGWRGRSKLSAMLRALAWGEKLEDVPAGVIELSYARKGRSAQSSVGSWMPRGSAHGSSPAGVSAVSTASQM